MKPVSDDLKKLVGEAFRAHATPSEAPQKARRRKKPAPASTITGDGNIVGDGNLVSGRDINISPVIRPKVVVKTGDGVVDAAQKAELKRLIGEWIEARNAVRKGDMSWPGAWSAFNAAFGLNKYDELKMEEFGKARAWIQRQTAIISSMRSAPKKMPNWRNGVIAAIKARSKNQLGDADIYRPYIQNRFGKCSLTELTDDELQTTRQYIFGKSNPT